MGERRVGVPFTCKIAVATAPTTYHNDDIATDDIAKAIKRRQDGKKTEKNV